MTKHTKNLAGHSVCLKVSTPSRGHGPHSFHQSGILCGSWEAPALLNLKEIQSKLYVLYAGGTHCGGNMFNSNHCCCECVATAGGANFLVICWTRSCNFSKREWVKYDDWFTYIWEMLKPHTVIIKVTVKQNKAPQGFRKSILQWML